MGSILYPIFPGVEIDCYRVKFPSKVWSGPVSFPELSVSGTTTINQTVNIRNPLGESSTSQSLEEYLAAVTKLQVFENVLLVSFTTKIGERKEVQTLLLSISH